MTDIPSKCPYCGANMKAYWHTLTPGLVSGLVEAIKFVVSHSRNSFHLQRDLNLSKSMYNNFQKLRFHALVAKIDEKPGYWLITNRGGQFLRGEIEVPRQVLTFRNKVQTHSGDKVHMRQFRDKVPYYEAEFAYETRRTAITPTQPTLI